MRSTVIFLIYEWLLWFSQSCLASDVLNAGEKITVKGSMVVSVGQRFQLGFFSPTGTSTGRSYYIGIWYYQPESSNPQTVVWVANRDNPVDSSGAFHIEDDGNLVITDASRKSYWSSNLEGSSSSSSSRNRSAVLMDNGNLVLLQENHLGRRSYLWQSFQHPTDTFLPGMKMDAMTKLALTCWKNPSEPGPGNFTFKKDNNRYIILENNQLYWESETSREIVNSDATFRLIVDLLNNFSLNTIPLANNSRNKVIGSSNTPRDYNYTSLVMNSTGELELRTRDGFKGDWSVQWKAPESSCQIYNACGTFSSCNINNNGYGCKCLPGFIKKKPESDIKGCTRKSTSCGEGIIFLPFAMVKVGNPDERFPAEMETDCKSKCVCARCQAYSYLAPTQRDSDDSNCWIWTRDLNTLQEENLDDSGRSLSILLHKSDIAPTPKTCHPCGTNEVPYPLSTGPKCGDPMYVYFSCNYTTGQLSFTAQNNTYKVTSIHPDSRTFTIQVNSSGNYCSYNRYQGDSREIQFPVPFKETNECVGKENDVEVTWQPPSEPVCTESEDCVGWNHSSCKGTSGSKRCLCDTNYSWNGLSLNCTIKETMSLDKPSSEEPKPISGGNSKDSLPLILGITLASAVVLACAIVFGYVMKRKQQDSESIQRNRLRFYDSERHVKDLIDVSELEERDNEGIEVPYYDFESILLATNNFSDENKLGRGGYGPVYKGKLQGGEVIAVKRLSSVSAQGLKEFKNEVVLIAKLQHRNLVRLRGYCIKGEEKILLYEYMPNGSLDLVIFDSTRSALLDWQMRFDIIVGIARGLLYLHQDSRLRVIHRDLKTSNILLDEEMQPKISDFGLARIVGGKETEANTERVVGTYGYMSPEYALDGIFSTKSDIFSFGVVLLEIISGKKNTGFYDKSKQISSLLGHAWRLYTENKLLDLMDMSLAETCNVHQFTKCAQIGLLCVQDEPGDRPTMSNVVTMLDSDTATLPNPKQPTFFASRGLSSTASSSKPEASVHFESSYQEGR